MTLAGLLALWRELTDDRVAPYRAPDALGAMWANEAVVEACQRGALLFDDSSDFCSLALTANVAEYDLDPSVRQIKLATLASTGQTLRQLTEEGVAYERLSTWRSETGTPTIFVRNGQRIRLCPYPSAADTLRLQVYRLRTESEAMTLDGKDSDSPPIAPAYHADLVYWMAYRYFSMRDADITPRADMAATFLGLFVQRFGEKNSARFDEISKSVGLNPVMIARRIA